MQARPARKALKDKVEESKGDVGKVQVVLYLPEISLGTGSDLSEIVNGSEDEGNKQYEQVRVAIVFMSMRLVMVLMEAVRDVDQLSHEVDAMPDERGPNNILCVRVPVKI